MGWLSFILQYATAPRSVGAVAPSSRYLARKMIHAIDFETAQCIVEFGPGTGVFTQEILRQRRLGTVVIIIERNADFCAQLRKKFADEQELHIIEGMAEQIGEYLHSMGFSHADYIVSGLPFTTLPAETGNAILTQAKNHLYKEGRFITFQYSLLRKSQINRHFHSIEVTREWRNLPPAYVLSCR